MYSINEIEIRPSNMLILTVQLGLNFKQAIVQIRTEDDGLSQNMGVHTKMRLWGE